MASRALSFSTSLLPSSSRVLIRTSLNKIGPRARTVTASFEKPPEELYHVQVERGVPKKRLEELGISRWLMWKIGKCRLPWDWHMDQLVYIVRREVKVALEGGKWSMRYEAGNLIRYLKWFKADLYFDRPYEELYRFLAYDDD